MFSLRKIFSTALLTFMLLLAQNSASAADMVPSAGNVKADSTPLCGLVLVNGVDQFTCNPIGVYDLQVPLNDKGVVEIQVFADGFSPVFETLTAAQAADYQVNMVKDPEGPEFQVAASLSAAPGGLFNLSGTVITEGKNVCALVLANGKKMFSCVPNKGTFSLEEVAPNDDGQIKLMVFARNFLPYTRVLNVDTNYCNKSSDECDFNVQISNTADQSPNFSSPTEHSYTWGFDDNIYQLSTGKIGDTWTAGGANGKTFNYLQTANFSDYTPSSASAPTAIVVQDTTNTSSGMTLQYANQTLPAKDNGNGNFHFDLSSLSLNSNTPYHFTIHPYGGEENRELAVWLGSTYVVGAPTTVSQLWNQQHRNHWITGEASGKQYLAYVGGLYDFATSNPGGFSLNLDMDLNGQAMNLSTNYALFQWVSGDDPERCLTSFNCQVQLIGQYTAPVTGPIIIAGSGRVNGYNLLTSIPPAKWDGDINKTQRFSQALREKAEYRVQSGLIELSASGAAEYPIDIAGITVGFSPQRNDSSVLLNNKNLPMASLSAALAGTTSAAANNHPVKSFDFKMVGNWIGASDGLDVQGDRSLLKYIYLHVADDSLKISARNIAYEQTTVLQGDVGTGGLVHLGSYGTARNGTQGSVIDGVYAHRITHKRDTKQNGSGFYGAALVAAQTCTFGSNVEDTTVKNLRVNNLDRDISSVNRPFNIGLGSSFGLDCGDSKQPTTVTKLTFIDFAIYLDPESDTTLFKRSAGPGDVSNINFFEGAVNTNPAGKVAIHNSSKDPKFAYFICGSSADKCWTTNGKDAGTAENVLYSPSSYIFKGINFPYGP